jgi:hypothetical protein
MLTLSFRINNPIIFPGYYKCMVHNFLNLNHLELRINSCLYYIYMMLIDKNSASLNYIFSGQKGKI